MEELSRKFYRKYAEVQTDLVRDYIDHVDWTNRLIGIRGSRGIGKTTMILQYIRMHYEADHKVLYTSLDDLYFLENKLYHLAEDFYNKGGELLALDEVHRYPNWAGELKNIYDDMPQLRIVFTGSSLLQLRESQADLSRRAVMYTMPGLSFREFLRFEARISFNTVDLNDLLEHHVQLAMEVSQKIKPLAYLSDYLQYGYYPFYKENKRAFHDKLSEVILTILEVDIPQHASIPPDKILYLKKLLRLISQSVPFKPNMKSLSERTGISLNTMKQYLLLLHKAELLHLLYVPDKGINSLNKAEKLYLNNTNLMYNLSPDLVNTGNLRESFFYNQLAQRSEVHATKETDFLINQHMYFEIGGKNKTRRQIKQLDEAYLVKDDIEIGSDRTIPLWLFGFLY